MVSHYLVPIVSFLFFCYVIFLPASSFSFPKMWLKPYPRRLILLDRDGVINLDVGSPGVLLPSQLRLIPNSALAVGNLKRAGHTVVLVTNQSCVGKGLLTPEGLEEMHDRLRFLLRTEDPDAVLDHVYCCTSLITQCDIRRKPNPGMVLEACREYNGGSSGEGCVFIGDTTSDLMAAASAGLETRVLVETGYGLGVMNGKRAPMYDHRGTGPESVAMVEKIGNTDVESLEYGLGREGNGSEIDPVVLPFIYAKDLFTAVEWIIGQV